MMNGVLRGLTWSTCLVYLDDIVVYTRGGIERHVIELATVLERLSVAGLTLKLKKCVFAAASMEYLGHELSSEGVRPVERLVTAVREFPRPRDPTEVKRFVHLAGYYRKFIEAFGSIMAPLTRLLKKSSEWEWTEEQEFAFERVKAALTTRPLLVYPNFDLPFRLVTDASKTGLGACLMQDQGRGWQPVAFASKVNSSAEANYSITELECLAVVWSVKLFRPYLYGRAFTIITDHSALKWLMTRPNLAGRLHRWSLTLQEYEFEILYRPGATNVVADALSRAPATVMAVVGRKRKQGRAGDQPWRAVGMETEEKTEEDLLSTSAAVREAEEHARRTAGQPVAAVVPDWAAEVPATARPSTSTASPSSVGRRIETAAAVRAQGPLTRAAKRRQETATAARHADPASTGRDDGGVDAQPVTATTAGLETGGYGRPPNETARRAMDERGNKPGRAPETFHSGRARRGPEKRGSQQTTKAAPPIEATREDKDGVVQGATTPTSGVTNTPTPRTPTINRTEEGRVTKAPKPKKGETTDGHGAAGPRSKVSQPPGVAEVPRPPMITGASDEMEGEDDVAPVVEETLQLTDDEIIKAQQRSRLVQKLVVLGEYRGMPVEQLYGLVVVGTPLGKRVVLPPALWAVVFKEMHGSVWAGHLRGPHTYGRISQLYWWPNLQREVKQWVRGCQECGSRKARPREVVPPLRSIHGGEVGDRWALDVAGPFPVADGGERYVIAALEYVTRYAVARSVTRHTAENVATFLMEDVVLRFGVFRELLTDGAPELTGEVIEKLVDLLQARQVNPVPYRPQMVGLVERFHRSWKDCVATYMANEQQNDWNLWVKFAVYAYNSANHSTVALTPNELMMGRRLRAPNELLRSTRTSEAGELPSYHARLVAAMVTSREHAEVTRTKEQGRQARYYNKKTRQGRAFNPGDRVWVYNPPRGAKATKFVHRWMGPARIVEAAGYDNFLLRREDKGGAPELIIAHVSFLVSYHSPEPLLERAAADIDAQLEYEEQGRKDDGEADAAAVRVAAAPTRTTTAPRVAKAAARRGKRKRKTMGGPGVDDDKGGRLVEVRRRRRRNRAGQYVLEYELRPISNWRKAAAGKWVSGTDYDRLFASGRVVEDPAVEEGV
ncbi:hypothetical protein PR003_g24087 [Phytophthora rubi]|uniref:Integrase catalytic domain-containing protein n=1 Tax=Phytophthora rubi TaxID=129364 RepID=A0A6A4CTX0_9STRA|nr:hypothetical protein PR003_g24087 [Phytophthora rubi]